MLLSIPMRASVLTSLSIAAIPGGGSSSSSVTLSKASNGGGWAWSAGGAPRGARS
jgi:hypothetical protein